MDPEGTATAARAYQEELVTAEAGFARRRGFRGIGGQNTDDSGSRTFTHRGIPEAVHPSSAYGYFLGNEKRLPVPLESHI